VNYDDIHAAHRNSLVEQYKSILQGQAFFEFGVYHGTSMLMWYDIYIKHGLPINFVGFDSFQGLPTETQDANTVWKPGMFSTNGAINLNLRRDGIRLVEGFYDQSLSEQTAVLLSGIKAGLVHMDCDLYSSTKTVWEWLLKYDLLAKNALIVYDDWGSFLEAGCAEYDIGEAKAHKEIETKYQIKFRDLGQCVINPNFYIVKTYQICN
jgi:methyltransferase family protein